MRWCVLVGAAVALGCSGGSSDAGGASAGGSGATAGSGAGGSGATGGSGAGGSGAACGAATHTGEGTYYAADGSGNCSFDPSPNDLDVAAMNHTDYAASAVCGSCVLATGPRGALSVRIVDQCPECAPGDIDFSAEAFAKIADPVQGRVPISWQYVACEVSGPIAYKFKEGSNQWWTAVQIRNHRYAIARFEYQDQSGAWVEVPRLDYNYFVQEAGMGPGPYSFRVTDVHDHQLVDTGIGFIEGGVVAGAAQFPDEC